jgi:hypothetical protein
MWFSSRGAAIRRDLPVYAVANFELVALEFFGITGQVTQFAADKRYSFANKLDSPLAV